jgi:hypothetical protein
MTHYLDLARTLTVRHLYSPHSRMHEHISTPLAVGSHLNPVMHLNHISVSLALESHFNTAVHLDHISTFLP